MAKGATASKIKNLYSSAKLAARVGAWKDLGDFVIYRSPLRRSWARLRGHRFHRSSIIWFADNAQTHTRITLFLPRLALDYPGLTGVDMDLEFFSEDGRSQAKWALKDVPPAAPFVLDSRRLPPELAALKAPFSGSLWVKQRLKTDDGRVIKKDGQFNATHTYIDYFQPGNFVATLHDYCAFLPDRGVTPTFLGMIPAYAGKTHETFLVLHAAESGIGPKDVEITISNSKGEERSAPLPVLAPFAMRRLFIGQIFPDAEKFLGGEPGQILLKGVFRQLLTRIAYGVRHGATGAFSMDHCYYGVVHPELRFTREQRKKIPKGLSNPFLVVEDDKVSTSAFLFQCAPDPDQKEVDLLVYDESGRCVARRTPFGRLEGQTVRRLRMRDILAEAGIRPPFVGHAEILHHEDPAKESYPRNLDLNVEYSSGGRLAHVIFGAELWNSSKPIVNENYRSACRIVCDDVHTTLLAISNVSYDYDYAVEVPFTLTLIGGGKMLASRRLAIAPNATIFKPIDEIFSGARELLAASGGVGLAVTTDINVAYLTHLFLTQDRRSGALSVEHSLDV